MLKPVEQINLDALTLEQLIAFARETSDFKRAARVMFGSDSVDCIEAAIHMHSYALERVQFITYIRAGDDARAQDTAYTMGGIYDMLPERAQWKTRNSQ